MVRNLLVGDDSGFTPANIASEMFGHGKFAD
jgi:hypothetical protein